MFPSRHKSKDVYVINEATDSCGSVWLQLARSEAVNAGCGERPVAVEYNGDLWVKFCGPDFKPQFKKAESFHTAAKLADKSRFLLALEAKDNSLLDYTGDEANDINGLPESVYVRMEDARYIQRGVMLCAS